MSFLDRCTEGAKRALALAQEAARAMGHNYVGSEHLLLGLILHYDAECRDALEKNAPMHKLFAIPARVDIGRAKSVPSDEYEQVYAKIAADMTAQIKEIIAGGEEQ